MTPREKAKELFRKFIAPTQQWDDVDGYITDEYNAKQCVLITVNEIISSSPLFTEYWEEVKQEIEKL